ncbi:putative GBF-interacting protein [Helianthus annuus]|nr:putative GBF-interacting protein [Helianthus annuus]
MKHLMWHWFIEPTLNMANPFLDNHTNLWFKFDYFFSALFFLQKTSYYMKDCSMDPNETAQKLLLQGFLSFWSFVQDCSVDPCYPFHEVRRKRDRKKENVVKESTETRWKPGMQGQGSRGGRGNYSSRHNSHGNLIYKLDILTCLICYIHNCHSSLNFI